MCINLYESMKLKRDDRAIEPLKRLFATKVYFGISRDKRDFLSPLWPCPIDTFCRLFESP